MKTCWWLFMLACLVVVPAVQASPIAAPISAPGFPEPLIAIGPLTAREQQDLSHFLASTPPGAPADLEAFLAAHPQSPYRLAILTDLGLAAYRQGAFSAAISFLEAAFQERRRRPAQTFTQKLLSQKH